METWGKIPGPGSTMAIVVVVGCIWITYKASSTAEVIDGVSSLSEMQWALRYNVS